MGNAFDFTVSLSKILREAKADILAVDPYMDEKFLTDFAVMANEGINIRVLADKADVYPSLGPAFKNWQQQHAKDRP